MVGFDEGDVSYVSYLAIWSGGEGRRLLAHIPNQPANSVLGPPREHACALAGAIMHSRGKAGQVILMESAGNMHLVVLPD